MLFLDGHKHEVRSLAWSPRGDLLASAGDDRTVRIWRLLPEQLLHTLCGHRRNVYALGFTPDGGTVISAGGDGQVRLWSVAKGHMQTTPAVHSRSVNCLAVHPTGAIATADGAWRTSSLAVVRRIVPRKGSAGAVMLRGGGATLSIEQHEISSLAFAPDGQRLAVATPRFLFLWTPRRKPARTIQFGPVTGGSRPVVEVSVAGDLNLLAEGAWYRSASFSPDSTMLVAAADARVQIFTPREGPRYSTLGAHEGVVNAVAFSPLGGVAASGGDDGQVRLWDAVRGVERVSFAWNIGPVQSLAFSPDGLSLAAGGQGRIVIWDVEEYY